MRLDRLLNIPKLDSSYGTAKLKGHFLACRKGYGKFFRPTKL